jgi:glycerate kinase
VAIRSAHEKTSDLVMTDFVTGSSHVLEVRLRGARVLVAMDKFRGTASARELCVVTADVLDELGAVPDVQPLSDGGEGFRDAFVGEDVRTDVTGPLGQRVSAGMTLVDRGTERLAVLESADAVGRQLMVSPTSAQALTASSEGVGELILAAAEFGATTVLVGLGGSATSDGGLGCYEVLVERGGLPVPVIAATDVKAHFSGARRYAAQKGVREEDLILVDERLAALRSRYLRERGVDVEELERTGAAGGIPGALVALGASLVDGLEAVAGAVDLASRIEAADLVITGEGRFDEGSLEGKVTGGLADMAGGRALLIVCGSVDAHAERELRARFDNLLFLDLSARVGVDAATRDVLGSLRRVLVEGLHEASTSQPRSVP